MHCEGMDSQTNIKQGGQTAFPPHSEVRRTAESRAKLPCLVLEPKVRTSSHNMHIQHTLGAHVPGFSAVPNIRARARAHTIHARIYGTCTYNTLFARARAHTRSQPGCVQCIASGIATVCRQAYHCHMAQKLLQKGVFPTDHHTLQRKCPH